MTTQKPPEVQPPKQISGAYAMSVSTKQEAAARRAALNTQKIISAVYRTQNRFGAGYIINILKGLQDESTTGNNHHTLKVSGS